MNRVRVDGWTAELVIIASNVNSIRVDDRTAEEAIIVSNATSKFKTNLSLCQTGSIVERHSLDIFEIFIKLRPNSV